MTNDGNVTERLTPKQVAALLGVNIDTLQEWRKRRIGPPFTRMVTRIIYKRSDIEAWEERNRVECGD